MSDTIAIPISLLIELHNDLSRMPHNGAQRHLEIVDRLLEGKCPIEDDGELQKNTWDQ